MPANTTSLVGNAGEVNASLLVSPVKTLRDDPIQYSWAAVGFFFLKIKTIGSVLEERLVRKGADNICNLKERSPLSGHVSLVFHPLMG